MKMNQCLGLCAVILSFLSSCGTQNTYRSDAQQNSDLETQIKTQELSPVANTYCGEMLLTQSKRNFQVVLTLYVGHQNEQSPASQDPTDIVQVPVLQGSMTFPAFSNSGGAPDDSLPDLTAAMGNHGSISFTSGDYNATQNQLSLPYTVAGYTGDYGQITGTLQGNQLSGSWSANSFTNFGTFVLTQCSSSNSSGSGS
jgi:hypothetical protein